MTTLVRGSTTRKGGLVWDPMVRQEVEPDTIYLFDPDVEADLLPAVDGLIGGNQITGVTADNPPWLGGTKMEVAAGKFRDGVKSLNTSGGYLYMPLSGLIPVDEFTIELWVKTDNAWNALGADKVLFRCFPSAGNVFDCYITGSTLSVRWYHTHGAAALTKAMSWSGAAIPGATWKNVAITLKDQTLKLYVDGVLVDTETGCTPPSAWTSTEGGGFEFVGGGEVDRKSVV